MISLGFSPCPNDTFIFYALVNKKIDTRGLDFDFIIEDVETLNRLALGGKSDVSKVSCHAFFHLQNEYRFLHTGGAFGRGCGPLVVAKGLRSPGDLSGKRIAIPGRLTTAFLLLKLFAVSLDFQPSDFVEMPFHEIMESVRGGKADAGLIIHESRFTYPDYGLVRIADLGEWWEKETGLPIPLGGIAARKALGPDVIRTIEELIGESVKYSRLHRDEAMPYIRAHARELSEEVIAEHIALYVNDYTVDIGRDGQIALDKLLGAAHSGHSATNSKTA
ncbi:MAG TPA: 1,4-dihydroxy-6-naphthoate synthase [Dissulfurispiraceae bacterium]